MKNKRLCVLFLLAFTVLFLCDCQKSIELTTTSKEAFEYYDEGMIYHYKFYYSDALQKFHQAFNRDSTFAMTALRLFNVHYQLGNKDSARFYLNLSKRLSKKASEYERLIVCRYWSMLYGNYDLSSSVLDTLLNRYPESLEVKLLNASYMHLQLDYNSALQLYLEIVEKHPEYVHVYNHIGYLYAKMGLFKESEKYFKKYLELAPDQLNPYDSLSEIYVLTGKYHEAIELINRALDLSKTLKQHQNYIETSLYLNLADAYQHLGQYQNAVQTSERAFDVALDDNSRQRVSQHRFHLFRELEQIDNMENELREIKGRGDPNQNLLMEGILSIEKRNFGESLKKLLLLQNRSNEEFDTNVKRNLLYLSGYLEAELNYKSGFYNEAAELFKVSAATLGDTAHAFPVYLKRYIALGEAGNYREAIAGLNSLHSINPNHPWILLQTGKLYISRGKNQEALVYLEYLRDLWKNADPDTPIMNEINSMMREINS